jgi:chromosome segregation ATPase
MDYFSQVALLNSLKLKYVKPTDFKAIEATLIDSQQYILLFRSFCAERIKSRLREKLRLELNQYMELDKRQQPKESNLDAITKMIEELKQDIEPVNKFFTNLDKTITAPPPQIDTISQLSAQRALKGMNKLKKRPR